MIPAGRLPNPLFFLPGSACTPPAVPRALPPAIDQG